MPSSTATSTPSYTSTLWFNLNREVVTFKALCDKYFKLFLKHTPTSTTTTKPTFMLFFKQYFSPTLYTLDCVLDMGCQIVKLILMVELNFVAVVIGVIGDWDFEDFIFHIMCYLKVK